MNVEESIKRIPPHSLEAEQSVIGSMIMDREAIGIALENVDEEDFYQPDLKTIFESIVYLYQHNQPVDLVTLKTRLNDLGQLDMVGGIEYISKLAISVPTSAHVEQYAKIVKEKSILRKLIKSGQEIIADGFDGKEKLETILNSAEERIFNIIQGRKTGEFTNISKIISDSLDMISEAYLNKGQVTGIPTGFPDLDHKTAGLQPSDLVLIAARPSMGKTAFAINVAQHAAVKENKSVAIFSLEMSKEQLARRMLCTQGLVDAQKVRIGDLTEEEWLSLIDASTVVGQSPIYIDDTPGLSVNEIRAKCRKLKLEKGLDLILIDYLQLMSGNGKKDSRQQEISEISRGLKGLAREMNAPVIALSQLSRACETRTDHRPILSDLRESGAIEQDADIVMFLYRDEYYHEDSEAKNQAELIIAKQRNGQTGTVHLAWLGSYTKFASLSHSNSDQGH